MPEFSRVLGKVSTSVQPKWGGVPELANLISPEVSLSL